MVTKDPMCPLTVGTPVHPESGRWSLSFVKRPNLKDTDRNIFTIKGKTGSDTNVVCNPDLLIDEYFSQVNGVTPDL